MGIFDSLKKKFDEKAADDVIDAIDDEEYALDDEYGYEEDDTTSITSAALKLKVVKPESYDDVTQIATHLLQGMTVVLNLENTNKETARRLIDFLSGVVFSIQGHFKNVAVNTFIITPHDVDVTGDPLAASETDEEVDE